MESRSFVPWDNFIGNVSELGSNLGKSLNSRKRGRGTRQNNSKAENSGIFFPGKKHFPNNPLGLTPGLSFSLCLFPCFSHCSGKGGSRPEIPTSEFLEAAPLLEVTTDQGPSLGGQGAIPLRFPGKRGWIPSQQGLFGKREPGFFMDSFPRVAPEFFSLLLPSLALGPAPKEQRIPLLLSLEKSGKQPEVKSLRSEVRERRIRLIRAGSGVQPEFKHSGIASRSPRVRKTLPKNHGKAFFFFFPRLIPSGLVLWEKGTERILGKARPACSAPGVFRGFIPMGRGSGRTSRAPWDEQGFFQGFIHVCSWINAGAVPSSLWEPPGNPAGKPGIFFPMERLEIVELGPKSGSGGDQSGVFGNKAELESRECCRDWADPQTWLFPGKNFSSLPLSHIQGILGILGSLPLPGHRSDPRF